MSIIHNEQTKLSATWLNGVSVAAIAVGGIAPVIAAVAGSASAMVAAALAVASFLVGIGLHVAARTLLRLLKDTP